MKKAAYIKLINEGMKKMSARELLAYFAIMKDFDSTNAWYEKTIADM